MVIGFNEPFNEPDDAALIQEAVSKLLPSVQGESLAIFAVMLKRLRNRYNNFVLSEALRQVVKQHPEARRKLSDEIAKVPGLSEYIYDLSLDAVAEALESAGLRLEDHMRVIDDGMVLTTQAVEAVAATRYPDIHKFGKGQDSLDGVGIDRKGGFAHPLGERMEADPERGIPEPTINLWAAASIIISGAHGWVEANVETCFNRLRECVNQAAPTVDFETLFRRSRYDDRALMSLCAYAHQGLDGKCDAAFNEGF